MRHSLSTSSPRDSKRHRISTAKNYRGRRPHRLVHHRQYPRTCGQRAVYRPERRKTYGKRLRRSPSRPRFYRENPEKVDKRRKRSNALEKEKETNHRGNPEEKLSKRELDRILDRLAADIEKRIEIYKKDQLSRILSRNIGPDRDDRGSPPEQLENKSKISSGPSNDGNRHICKREHGILLQEINRGVVRTTV